MRKIVLRWQGKRCVFQLGADEGRSLKVSHEVRLERIKGTTKAHPDGGTLYQSCGGEREIHEERAEAQ